MKKNSRGRYSECSEHDVIYWSDERGIEYIKRLVEIVHLNRDTRAHGHCKEPRQRILKLTVATQSQFEGYAESLARHDRERTDERADCYVDQYVGLPVHRAHPVYQVDCYHDGKYSIEEKSWGEREGDRGRENDSSICTTYVYKCNFSFCTSKGTSGIYMYMYT